MVIVRKGLHECKGGSGEPQMTERKRSQKGRKRGVDELGFILKLKIWELGKA
jgi:hypothetical protein